METVENIVVEAKTEKSVYDPHSLQVKKEYLIEKPATEVPASLADSEKEAKLFEEQKTENGSVPNSQNEATSKRGKHKGQNKHRPAPMKVSMADRLCPSLVDVGENEDPKPCPYPGKCHYQHDLTAYMKEKKSVDLPDGCYVYRTIGRCPRGVCCLYGAEHITPEGRNKIHPAPLGPNSSSKNFLDKDIQFQLRKKTYDFSRAQDMVEYVKANKHKTPKNGEPSEKKMKTSGPFTDDDKIALRQTEKRSISWQDKLYLAPLTTVGNLPFRRLCKKLGADITCGEMAMADSLLDGGQQEWALVRRHSSEDLFGVQICGSNPYTLTRCVQLLEEQTEVDFIDLNLGCPIDLVYKKGMGSGLMIRSGPLENSITSMANLLKIPLTVKMRVGVYDGKPFAHKLVQECREMGVSMVTVHGRSREQRYTRLADWDYIGQCVKAAAPMPIYGNGDLLSFEDYQKHKEEAGVAGVMIARGALMKPWIFTEIKESRHWDISSRERFDLMKDFVNYGLEHWGSDTQGVERTRRFLLEWQSFSHRYVPYGLLEHPPQGINQRPPFYKGRDELETLMASPNCADWIRLSEMLLGPVPDTFQFLPKHKANSWK